MTTRPDRPPAVGGAVLRPRLTEAISEAALEELVDKGYARLSMEAVARRAGAGKAALYRRWPSKQAMLTDLIRERTADVVLPDPDTGALRTDLRALLDVIRDQLTTPFVEQVGLGLLAEAHRDPALAEVLRAGLADPRREVVRVVVRRAVERGELPPECDPGLGTDLLIAPLAFRILVIREACDDQYLDTLTDAVASALKGSRRSLDNAST